MSVADRIVGMWEAARPHRRRIATGALLLFLAAVALEIGGAIPREVEIAVPLGRAHGGVTEAEIEYLLEGEPVRTVTRRFARGAPREVRDSATLSPGDYTVRVSLLARDGERRALEGRLTAPSDGVVRIAMEDR